jgi:hypothetical protein
MIPLIHAQLSAKRFGGVPEDYLDIHELMDSSKNCFPTNAHRILTHNSWFVTTILVKCFGHQRTNSDDRVYNVKDVGEYHCLEDFKMRFIPSPQDYIQHLDIQPWMNNAAGGDVPMRLKTSQQAKANLRAEPEQSSPNEIVLD